MANQSMAALSRLLIGGTRFAFTRLTDSSVHTLNDRNNRSITGQLMGHKELVGEGINLHRFKTFHDFSRSELIALLDHVGFEDDDPDGKFFGETLSAVDIYIDRVVDVTRHQYSYLSALIIRGQRGAGPLSCECHWVAKDASYGQTFPSVDYTASAGYEFNNGVIGTVLGATREFNRFVLVLNRNLAVEFYNNTEATRVCPANLEVQLGLSAPFASPESTLFTTPAAGLDDTGGILQFTDGTNTSTFTLASLITEAKPPSILRKKDEIMYDVFYNVYDSGTTHAINAVHSA